MNKKERSYVAQLTYIVHGFPEKLQLVLGHGLNLHTRKARTLQEKMLPVGSSIKRFLTNPLPTIDTRCTQTRKNKLALLVV